MSGGGIEVSAEARRYALRELCRRARLDDEIRCHWRVECGGDGRTFSLCANEPYFGRIEFPANQGRLCPDRAGRKAWPFSTSPAVKEVVPDFVIPYAQADSVSGEPLFLEMSRGMFRCTEDMLSSTALVLSRFEELNPPRRDVHGRFEAATSMAVRDGYLERPIIDEYGLALQAVFQVIMPAWNPPARRMRVKLSHDIDEIGIPFSLRDAAVQLIARRSIGAGIRDLLSGIATVMPGSLRQVIEICRLAEQYGLRSALYWKASNPGPYDSGYSMVDPRVAEVVAWARERNIEMGVHPGYETFLSLEELRREVSRCREALRRERIGGRQHYLRWRPETWAHWEQCGLEYDSSLGYADRVGFRAGTCVPYRPWLWNENRCADLMEIPLIMMDRTLTSTQYMGLSPDESMAQFKTLMSRCEAVGGVMTLLWHNNCLGRPFSAYLPRILQAMSGTENYDWESDVVNLRRADAVA